MNKHDYNPYLALKTILEMTADHIGEEFIKIAGEQIKKMFQADFLIITKALNFNPTTKAKILYSSSNNNDDIYLANTPCQMVFDNKIINISKNVKHDFSSMEDSEFESFYGIPITDDKGINCIGHIAIYSKKSRILPIDFDEIALIYTRKIRAETKRIALENENEEIKQKLQEMVIRDPLTNLYNRRHFIDTCDEVLSKVKRDNSKATLAYLDIDDFKNINDTFGHNDGDIVLKKFSQIISKNKRKGLDFVFRLGGEEFCILSIESSLEESLIQQKRIMKSTTDYFLNTLYNPITISIGLINITNKFNNASDIINEADNKMYEAKNTGKNKIII